MKVPSQRIRYVRVSDGVKLAWAEIGKGPALVKAANWLTHLQYDLESPVWKHWIRFFSENFRYIRHDERGCGMTDVIVGDMSVERWTDDLEAVIDAADLHEPFVLLGISQGSAACLGYLDRHPERVSHLILYGGYARGPFKRNDLQNEKLYRALIELIRQEWESQNPSFRQVFTSRFIPRGTDEQVAWFNELCLKTTPGAVAAQLLESRAEVDVTALLSNVRVPTLVLHSRGDGVVPLAEGRLLAAGIPGAQFIELDSSNHVLLESEPAWEDFCREVLRFTGVRRAHSDEDAAFAELSKREREILSLITEGLSNAEIAQRLSISDKTVRNHVSKLFDKLGVWTRAQAMVFARDRNFQSTK